MFSTSTVSSAVLRRLLIRLHAHPRYMSTSRRTLSQASSPKPSKKPAPPSSEPLAAHPPNAITRLVRRSPAAKRIFLFLTTLMGYGSRSQVAARNARLMYRSNCMEKDSEEVKFWRERCHLPATLQTWFTITNLHVWMLTVRFRALPPPYGKIYVQVLLDHFFLDVEDRIRTLLTTDAPERLVTQQMKIFREQSHGLTLAFDLALASTEDSDAVMAGAIWRNLLGARGAQGITGAAFRRSVNIAFGSQADEFKDDMSGVSDFQGQDVDLYVRFPETIYAVDEYIRRELQRLEAIPHIDVLENASVGKFGPIQP